MPGAECGQAGGEGAPLRECDPKVSAGTPLHCHPVFPEETSGGPDLSSWHTSQYLALLRLSGLPPAQSSSSPTMPLGRAHVPPPFSLLPFSISLSPFKSRKGPKGSPALGHHLSKARTFPGVGKSGERDAEHSPHPPAQACPDVPWDLEEHPPPKPRSSPDGPWGERPEGWPCCTLAQGRARGQRKMQAGASGSMG